MDESLVEDVRLRVRGLLSSANVRLWLPPYVDDDLETLADDYSKRLQLEHGLVLDALKELRIHSIERASANERFKETGVASLRLTVSPAVNGTKNDHVDIVLNSTGNELIVKISEKLSVETTRLKLIHKGRVVRPDTTLIEQNIKNGAQILVVLLAGDPESLKNDSEMYKALQMATRDVETLADSALGETFMQLEDQSGHEINLPPSEKKALMIAMTLHEKGRTAVKRENYPLALIFLLEADKHFSECNSAILQSVDNYALLNLDIAWCYLCVQSITHVPDAEARLKICEKNFHKSYGENLERLIALKGTSGNEKALFMRLHLLQGVVLYHQNKRSEAKATLSRARLELNALKINDSSLCNLVEMGYTLNEARIGLRAAEGSVQGAVTFIAKSRKAKAEKAQKAKDDWEGQKLGLCDDNEQFVSIKCVQTLQDMGYNKYMAVLALKRCNNNISNAVQLIQEKGESIMENAVSNFLFDECETPDPDLIQHLVHIGYEPAMAERALSQCSFDLNSAIDLLIKCGGIITESHGGPSTSNESYQSKTIKDMKKKVKKMNAAYSRLSEGIENTEDDYLNISLEQEEIFLKQYMNLLE